jgi:hypothetical protein
VSRRTNMGLHYKDHASPINISDKVSFRQSDQDQHRKCPPIVTILFSESPACIAERYNCRGDLLRRAAVLSRGPICHSSRLGMVSLFAASQRCSGGLPRWGVTPFSRKDAHDAWAVALVAIGSEYQSAIKR